MRSTNINNPTKEVREPFNELRSNLSREETKKKKKIEKNSIKKKLFIIL